MLNEIKPHKEHDAIKNYLNIWNHAKWNWQEWKHLKIFLNPLEKLYIAKDTLIQFEDRPQYIFWMQYRKLMKENYQCR